MEVTSRFEPMPGELMMVPPPEVVLDELLDELPVPVVPELSELSREDKLLLDEVALVVMESALPVLERSPPYGGGLRAPGKTLVR